jgi:hypothetical protein
VGVAEASGDAAGEFDQAVDGFGAPVVGAVGGEVAQECVAPLVQGSAESGDLGDRAGGERGEDLLRDPAPVGVAGLVIDRSQLLGAAVGDLDLDVTLVGDEGCFQAGPLPVGEVLDAGAQDVADPVERVGLAAAVAVDVLLDPATDLVDGGRAEFDGPSDYDPTLKSEGPVNMSHRQTTSEPLPRRPCRLTPHTLSGSVSVVLPAVLIWSTR